MTLLITFPLAHARRVKILLMHAPVYCMHGTYFHACMLVVIHACVAHWWVWPQCAKSGAAMAAMLGPLPTPLELSL